MGLVGLLGLMLVAMKVAADPNSWGWMFPHQAVKESPAEAAKKKIDHTIRLDDENPLKPGEFRSRKAPQPHPQPRKDASSTSIPSSTDAASQIDVEIDKHLLQPVRDNTLGVVRDEFPAYYAILAKARDLPPSLLEQAARDDISYTVLMVDPDDFRGRLLTIEGDVKRLVKFPAGRNANGIEELYEAWLFTRDSGNDPYRVVCTSLPAGIPQGGQLTKSVHVRVTAYFFKREGYVAQHGLHTAPLLLAKRMRWFPPRATKLQELGPVPFVVGFVLLISVAFGLAVSRFSAGGKAVQHNRWQRITEAPEEALEALKHIETTDV